MSTLLVSNDCGLLSFGHAAFLATAGYVVGHCMKVWGWPVELSLLAAVTVSAALGVVIGGLAIRRTGICFAMITLALSQRVYFVFVQAPFTSGEDGLQGVPRGRLRGFVALDDDITTYHFVAAVLLAAYLFIQRVVHTTFGQVPRGLREIEVRAVSLNHDVERFEPVAFVLSAALAGVSGAMKTLTLGFELLADAHWHTSRSSGLR